uniref:Uncharacterized protein n=1 Tax=Strigamia maritima TaxID=126957 RepID=T1JJG3_STRMM
MPDKVSITTDSNFTACRKNDQLLSSIRLYRHVVVFERYGTLTAIVKNYSTLSRTKFFKDLLHDDLAHIIQSLRQIV